MERPVSVTIIAALLIFFGTTNTFVTWIYWNDFRQQDAGAGPWLAVLNPSMAIAGLITFVVGGMLMLRGVNAARVAYLVYMTVALISTAALHGLDAALALNSTFFLATAYFLSRQPARAYFHRPRL